MYRYRHDFCDGRYLLCNGEGRVVSSSREVAVAFSAGNRETLKHVVLHKHGDPVVVNQWLLKTRQKFAAAKIDEYFFIYKPINGWDISVLNKVINKAGYIGLYLIHYGYVIRRGVLLPPIESSCIISLN